MHRGPVLLKPWTTMEPKVTFVCLTVAVFTVNGVLGQVASICRPNERLLPCGCPKTCRDPVPSCKGVCQMGCFCNEDEVRNDTGHCVKLAECPPISFHHKLDTSEPRSNGGDCPENEEYRFCEPCNRTCDNPNPMCPAQCARGCFCKGDLVRDKDGRCVNYKKCSKFAYLSDNLNLLKPIAYEMTCSQHQIYKPCETCERTCSDPRPDCPTPCKMGCFCEKGFVKAPSGQCVKLEDCPKAEVTLGGTHELSVEDCASDEEFLSCGWCEPSCSDPAPSCPIGVCTRGCLCRPPLLRHRSGHCVEEKDCLPQRCSDPDEEYVCRYGCEPRCGLWKCPVRPRRGSSGCHSRAGLLRHSHTAACVTRDKCTNLTLITKLNA